MIDYSSTSLRPAQGREGVREPPVEAKMRLKLPLLL